MKTTAAVTGASGHIGNVLVPLLIDRGYRVRALVYKQGLAIQSDSLEIVKGSLDNREALDRLVNGCNLVIHCAAHISIKSRRDPSVYEINYSGTKNVFEASLASGVKRFIHLSSIHAFDQLTKDTVLDENTGQCSDNAPLYDVSKRDAEKYVMEHAIGKMEVVVLNPTSVVGPHDTKPSLMGKALMDIYNRKVPMLIKGGFDFCDVRDVAGGIVIAIDKARNGEKYLLSGKWHSLEEIQEYIVNLKEDKRKLLILPSWLAWIGLPFIKIWAFLIKRDPLYTRESIMALVDGHRNISSKKAGEELAYSCRSFEETVADTIKWFKNNGYLK